MANSNPIVEIKDGKLMGKLTKTSNNFDFYVFRGIPYAKPPVNELRFAEPVPPEKWDGVRDATKVCNICSQFDKATSQIVGDEDCLYLNVYTPSLPKSNSSPLPVMVFFHGGGFLFGNGTDDEVHGPDYLIEKDVVIVGLNYRVGILGFLALDRKDATGNMGLKDQVLALKWVQNNIQNFNGDPSNVTIFGFSAGAASVEYLLLSPTTKGLFHKAIAHSGSSLLPWAQSTKIRELSQKIPLMKKTPVSNDDELLEYLKKMPVNDLVLMSLAALGTETWKGGIHFGYVPVIEKPNDWEPFVSKSTYELLLKGDFHKVPFITGFCSREGLLMHALGALALQKVCTEKSFVSYLPFELDDKQKVDIDSRMRSVYENGEKKYKDAESLAVDFFTDLDFLGGTYVAASLIAKKTQVYFFEFAYDGNANYLKKKLQIDREGACHGDDGGYIVQCELVKDKLAGTDLVVKERMCRMWTDFVKYGNPTPKVDDVITTKWEPIGDGGMAYLLIDEKLTMKTNPYPERMNLFTELYEKYYKL